MNIVEVHQLSKTFELHILNGKRITALHGIDLAIGERTGGPVFLTADGRRLDRHGGASEDCPLIPPA